MGVFHVSNRMTDNPEHGNLRPIFAFVQRISSRYFIRALLVSGLCIVAMVLPLVYWKTKPLYELRSQDKTDNGKPAVKVIFSRQGAEVIDNRLTSQNKPATETTKAKETGSSNLQRRDKVDDWLDSVTGPVQDGAYNITFDGRRLTLGSHAPMFQQLMAQSSRRAAGIALAFVTLGFIIIIPTLNRCFGIWRMSCSRPNSNGLYPVYHPETYTTVWTRNLQKWHWNKDHTIPTNYHKIKVVLFWILKLFCFVIWCLAFGVAVGMAIWAPLDTLKQEKKVKDAFNLAGDLNYKLEPFIDQSGGIYLALTVIFAGVFLVVAWCWSSWDYGFGVWSEFYNCCGSRDWYTYLASKSQGIWRGSRGTGSSDTGIV